MTRWPGHAAFLALLMVAGQQMPQRPRRHPETTRSPCPPDSQTQGCSDPPEPTSSLPASVLSRRSIRCGRTARPNAGGSTCRRAPASKRGVPTGGSCPSARASGRSSASAAAASRRGICGRHRSAAGWRRATPGIRKAPMRCGCRTTASPARSSSRRAAPTTSRRGPIALPVTARRGRHSASTRCSCPTTAIRTRSTASRWRPAC